LEKQGSAFLLENFGVADQSVGAELQELSGVAEEDGSGGLLVVAAVAGVEHLDAQLSVLVWLLRRNRVTG
jgi:hypothetical protein